MKEIKAFIRSNKADKVIEAMKNLDVADITLIDVIGMGKHLADPNQAKYSIEVINKYVDLAKIEIVCNADDVDQIVQTLRDIAYTGMKGDGMIYVSPVEFAVKIRTGAKGKEAL